MVAQRPACHEVTWTGSEGILTPQRQHVESTLQPIGSTEIHTVTQPPREKEGTVKSTPPGAQWEEQHPFPVTGEGESHFLSSLVSFNEFGTTGCTPP